MLTYTGIQVTKEFGAPSIRDIAVQGMRLCRFAGAFERYFWPIGMHSMLVADLLPEGMKHHGYLHDASEVVMGDIPKPCKVSQQKALELSLTARLYSSLGVRLPNGHEAELIHKADLRACNVEGQIGCGPRGYIFTQPNLKLDDEEAHEALEKYLIHARAEDWYSTLFNPDGMWPKIFENSLRASIRDIQVDQYTQPA